MNKSCRDSSISLRGFFSEHIIHRVKTSEQTGHHKNLPRAMFLHCARMLSLLVSSIYKTPDPVNKMKPDSWLSFTEDSQSCQILLW